MWSRWLMHCIPSHTIVLHNNLPFQCAVKFEKIQLKRICSWIWLRYFSQKSYSIRRLDIYRIAYLLHMNYFYGRSLTAPILIFFYYIGKKEGLQDFLHKFTFCVSRKKEIYMICNHMRMSKWWLNFHFCVNYPYKVSCGKHDFTYLPIS